MKYLLSLLLLLFSLRRPAQEMRYYVDPTIGNDTFSGTSLTMPFKSVSSSMIDAGVNVGIPFKGAAPDLGAFEYEVITGVKPSPARHALLDQNFPNPFRLNTTIDISLEKSEPASLKVYDAAYRETDTLVDATLAPGTHRYSWNSANKPAGVYYCVLKTATASQSRKMIVVK